MKREALNHPKMLDLAARLEITQAQAIGHVTLLINWTADFAIQGDVGKWPNGAIARGAGWDTSPDAFVDALVDSGWLDLHETARLLLHDWPDHAERWVRSKLAAVKLEFHESYGAAKRGKTKTKTDTSPPVSQDTSPPVSRDPPRDRTEPNQTEPNETKPKTPLTPQGETSNGRKPRKKPTPYTAEFESFWGSFPSGRKGAKRTAFTAYERARDRVDPKHLEFPYDTPDAYLAKRAADYAMSPKGRSEFVSMPATWLNGDGWEDDPASWQKGDNGKPDTVEPEHGDDRYGITEDGVYFLKTE